LYYFFRLFLSEKWINHLEMRKFG